LLNVSRENAALKAQVERLKAPVTDAEWLVDIAGSPCGEYALVDRHFVDALIAARAAEKGA
jgi:hypothetical protein